jgi:glycosyltransferase involved in cell wall biosynthesis
MISIITVVRNGASTIERTILSVINQDYIDFEYIVIDGVSTDGTLSILEKYSNRINKIISEPDAGIYDAMNKGIILAKGDWVYFLGCDDVFYNKSTLSNIFSTTKYEDIDVIYGNVQFLHSNKIYDGEFDEEKMCDMSICQQAIFYRRDLFQKYGYFDAEYKTAADHVFNIKIYCVNIKRFLYVDEIISTYNELGASRFPESKFLDRSFAIRYDNFKALNSKFILSKIFWSSYFRYFTKNNICNSIKYFILAIKDIGAIRLVTNLFILIKKRHLKSL